MRITQWGEYGVLIAVYLACKQTTAGRDDTIIAAAEIAEAQGIALQYAQQILLRLRDGEIVESVRGPHGGYRLTKPPGEISLLEVLLAAEGASFEVICDTKPIRLPQCIKGNSCFLQEVWRGLKDNMDAYLKKYTLARLASEASKQEAAPN